jgi:hypothetical protein
LDNNYDSVAKPRQPLCGEKEMNMSTFVLPRVNILVRRKVHYKIRLRKTVLSPDTSTTLQTATIIIIITLTSFLAAAIIIIIIIMKHDVTGGWRKLHNKEFHKFYSSPNIIIIIKSRRMRWEGHVARMGRMGMCVGYWWESQKEREN